MQKLVYRLQQDELSLAELKIPSELSDLFPDKTGPDPIDVGPDNNLLRPFGLRCIVLPLPLADSRISKLKESPMKRTAALLLGLAVCISSFVQASTLTPIATDQTLTASQAKDHVGEKATVCGVVASTRYAAQSKGAPTFVNLDKPYPNQVFTILIWGEDLPKFSTRPSGWEAKRVCATGAISSYRGIPEIVVKSPDQILLPNPGQATSPQTSPSTPAGEPPPVGATAKCRDGTYTFSQSRRGTCSHHGGVAQWL